MDVQKAASIFMLMKVGESRNERWFIVEKEVSKYELTEMVENGWLIRKDKDPKELMSDVCYVLTQSGFDVAWSKKR